VPHANVAVAASASVEAAVSVNAVAAVKLAIKTLFFLFYYINIFILLD